MQEKSEEGDPLSGTSREDGGCLLVVPRGAGAPAVLLDGLRERGVSVEQVGDAPGAMAALAARRFSAVVLVQPPMLPDAEWLIASLSRHYPAVHLWRYTGGDQPRLEPRARESDMEATTRQHEPEIYIASLAPPPPRSRPGPVECSRPGRPPIPAFASGESQPGAAISVEELEMLLDDDDEPRRRAGG